ncbi:DinB family protein [Flagellimonas nanhaiensis]|uniref:DinB family protein n=1 Tax=Flagellimonas nanhaiensis TaxID=2292706 RepID=A0A371JQ58_9FLAO|nr:hypothetical protein [Allomuricauda nanhaiensis]RDY59647.1 hypothetical protein DX873_09755 [Allomuricauda nanhaiensis]
MAKYIFIFATFLMSYQMQSQELPYYQIPDYPEDFGPGNVVSRMIDGLGFRYYWATEGLTQKDLEYKPSEDGRTPLETMEHIHSMSKMILNGADATPNIRSKPPKYSYEELRKMTLENLQAASKKMAGKQSEDLEKSKVVFQNGEEQSAIPYWNMINGMLSDCIYHAGQITLMRRASGNPINPNISMFFGKLRDKK